MSKQVEASTQLLHSHYQAPLQPSRVYSRTMSLTRQKHGFCHPDKMSIFVIFKSSFVAWLFRSCNDCCEQFTRRIALKMRLPSELIAKGNSHNPALLYFHRTYQFAILV